MTLWEQFIERVLLGSPRIDPDHIPVKKAFAKLLEKRIFETKERLIFLEPESVEWKANYLVWKDAEGLLEASNKKICNGKE